MNFKLYLSAILASIILIISCSKEDLTENGLTNEEIIEGLKTALKVGTDSAVGRLSLTNGYFLDQAVKILLPDEMQNTINSFKSASKTITVLGQNITLSGEDLYDGYSLTILGTPIISIDGVKQKEDDLVLGLNRAAEYASTTAGPIFKDAITGMTVVDGINILKGTDSAATTYLKDNTYNPLFNTYEPVVDSALQTVKISNTSVVDLYEDYVTSYNSIVNTSVLGNGSIGSILGVNAIATTDVSSYGTGKALNGLFKKVAGEEKNIREDPLHRVTDILKKVFGELDK